jgi:hypothetical protein
MLQCDVLFVIFLALGRSVFGLSAGNLPAWTPPYQVSTYAISAPVNNSVGIPITQGRIHVPRASVKAPLVILYNGFGVCAAQLPAVALLAASMSRSGSAIAQIAAIAHISVQGTLPWCLLKRFLRDTWYAGAVGIL